MLIANNCNVDRPSLLKNTIINKQMKIRIILGGIVYMAIIVLFMYLIAGVKDIPRLLITATIASLLFILFSHFANKEK